VAKRIPFEKASPRVSRYPDMQSNDQPTKLGKLARVTASSPVRFVLFYGLPFGLLLGGLRTHFSHEPFVWYIDGPLYLGAGLAWGVWMWFSFSAFFTAKRK
jgi:hypothetical protein